MTKLFIGGLPYALTDQKLKELFEQFGQVLSSQVVMDKFTNQSKGFGFVEMSEDSEAQEAIKALNGSSLEGRTLGVSVARPREERSGSSYGNRNFNDRDNNRGGSFNRDRRGGRR